MEPLDSRLDIRVPMEPAEFYQQALGNSGTATFIIDHNRHVVLWNRACEALTGFPAHEIIGTQEHWRAFGPVPEPTLADLVMDADVAAIAKAHEHVIVRDGGCAVQGWFTCGGSERFLSMDAVPIYDEHGQAVAALQSIHDLTVFQKASCQLTESAEMFSNILDGLDVVVYVSDMETYEVLYQNKHCRERFGDGVGELCYKVFQKGQEEPCPFCTNKQLLEPDGSAAKPYVWDFRNTLDGRWNHIIDRAMRWVDGRMVRMEIATDITERKRAEEELQQHREHLADLVRARTTDMVDANARLQMEVEEHRRTLVELRESEERFRGIYAQSPIGIQIYDARGRLYDANRSCLEMFGVRDSSEIKGISLFENPIMRPELLGRLKSGQSVRCEVTFDFSRVHELHLYETDKKGLIHLDAQITPLPGRAPGTVIGYLVQYQDVTSNRKLEAQLRHAQKMEAIGHLAGGVAHDFNNILSAITNYAYLLSIKVGEQDQLKEYIGRIMASAERAATLTQSLLAFSRKRHIEPAPVDLNSIVSGVEKLLSRLIGEDVALSMRLHPQPLPAMADRTQIEQVLINLATNARDAMPQGGSLSLGTERVSFPPRLVPVGENSSPSGEFTRISVADTGSGMDEKTLQNIFEPFFTTKETGKGTGLGLAIAYGIIEQHGGFIDVDSTPGVGTTFHLYLPLLAASVDDSPRQARQLPMGQGELVLLAEDDTGVRKVTVDILMEFGYRVLEAQDGKEAVELFKSQGQDVRLLILDLVMPRQGGLDTYVQIRGMAPDVSVLFISGYPAELVEQQGGSDVSRERFLMKPITPADLLNKARAAIDSKAAQ